VSAASDKPAVAGAHIRRHGEGLPLLAAYGIDLLLGDPRRLHPVAGFGTIASIVERRFYAPTRLRGALVAGGLVAGSAGLVELLARATSRRLCLLAVTWTATGGRTLRREAEAVTELVQRDELDAARFRLRSLCGRDAQGMPPQEIIRGVVESLAENTSDAVVAPLLWGALAGPAGVAAHRAANTLDAMFGHHTERYARFGWAAAHIDDVMGWPAARLTAALTAVLAPLFGGSTAQTLAIIRRDGRRHASPNAGLPESAFAGALGLRFGGRVIYQGEPETMPTVGDGEPPQIADVARTEHLSIAVGLAAALACAAAASVRGWLLASRRVSSRGWTRRGR
jgi:adenosylcobinamide-phosphate synthase